MTEIQKTRYVDFRYLEFKWLQSLIRGEVWVCMKHPLLPSPSRSLITIKDPRCDCPSMIGNDEILINYPSFVNGFYCRLNEYVRGS